MKNPIYLREDQINTLVAMLESEIAEINKNLAIKNVDFKEANLMDIRLDYLRGIIARLMRREA